MNGSMWCHILCINCTVYSMCVLVLVRAAYLTVAYKLRRDPYPYIQLLSLIYISKTYKYKTRNKNKNI